jgi:sec-independent protein translocase protein TatA
MGFLKEPSHLLLVLVIVVILFGSRRLPDVARGLGQSMRIFKAEVKQMKDEDENTTKSQRKAEPAEPLEGKIMGQPAPRTERADEPVRETPRNL